MPPKLVAGATAAAAASAAGGWAGIAGAVGVAEDGELDGIFLTGTLGAGNFLLAVQNDLFKADGAIVANIFVNRHLAESFKHCFRDYSRGPATRPPPTPGSLSRGSEMIGSKRVMRKLLARGVWKDVILKELGKWRHFRLIGSAKRLGRCLPKTIVTKR